MISDTDWEECPNLLDLELRECHGLMGCLDLCPLNLKRVSLHELHSVEWVKLGSSLGGLSFRFYDGISIDLAL